MISLSLKAVLISIVDVVDTFGPSLSSLDEILLRVK